MELEQKLKAIVSDVLKVKEDLIHDDLAAGEIPEWDSLAHTTILQNVEQAFNISLDVRDAIEIETFGNLVSTIKNYLKS